MKKQILIMLGIILLVGTIIAVGELTKSNSVLDLDKDKVDLIKSTGIKDINIKSNPMTCDDKECWAWIYQENLIQTEFRTPKSYCTKTIEVPITNEEGTIIKVPVNESYSEILTETICTEYTDYTLTELIKMRDDFIKLRLEGYAETIKARQEKVNTKIDDGGIITTK